MSVFASASNFSPAEVAVLSRYLTRHRRHRLTGGILGTLFAVTVGIRWYSSVTIGVGNGSPLADVLFCGLVGVLVGALSAETFRLSEPVSSTVSASMAQRPGPSRPDLIGAARGLSLTSLGLGGLVAATGNGMTPLLVAAGGLIMAAVAEAAHAAVMGRRRPVMSDRAKAVDLAMRWFAGATIARLQLAAAILTLAWTVSKSPGPDAWPVGVIRFLVVVGGLVATVVLLHRASPRPPRGWVPEPS